MPDDQAFRKLDIGLDHFEIQVRRSLQAGAWARVKLEAIIEGGTLKRIDVADTLSIGDCPEKVETRLRRELGIPELQKNSRGEGGAA